MDLTVENQGTALTTGYVGLDNGVLKIYNPIERTALKAAHKVGTYLNVTFNTDLVGIALLKLIKSNSEFNPVLLKAQYAGDLEAFLSDEYTISSTGVILNKKQAAAAKETAERTKPTTSTPEHLPTKHAVHTTQATKNAMAELRAATEAARKGK